jgi:hypothetical protein
MGRLLRQSVLGVMLALAVITVSGVPALADSHDFDLVNDTGANIAEAYVKPSNEPNWGDNVLREPLAHTNTVTVTFDRFTPSNCLYDIKVVTDEGNEGSLTGVDLCQRTTVTFVPT